MRDITEQVAGSEEERAAEQVAASREAIEALEPKRQIEALDRVIEFENWLLPDNTARVKKTYTQAPLGMMDVNEFTTLVGELIEQFTQGEEAGKLGELFRGEVERPVELNPETVNEFVDDNMPIVNAFLKAIRMWPDFQFEIYVMSLGVPRKERPWAKACLMEPPQYGGLTADEGIDLLTHFIRQNARMIREKLLGKIDELVEVFRLEVLREEPKKDEDQASSDSGQTETTTHSVTPTSEATETSGTSPSSPGSTPSSTSSPATQASA